MKRLIAILAASAALAVLAPVVSMDIADARSKAKSTESAPAPSKETGSPSEGAASGEKGAAMPSSSGQATNEAWDQTYESDLAQEKRLKAGGK